MNILIAYVHPTRKSNDRKSTDKNLRTGFFVLFCFVFFCKKQEFLNRENLGKYLSLEKLGSRMIRLFGERT